MIMKTPAQARVVDILEEMSRLAKAAKKIEEITQAMDHIALQTTFLALDAAVLNLNARGSQDGFSQINNSVQDAAEEMYQQFNLLIEEVSSVEKTIKSKREEYLKVSGLN